MFKFPLVIAHRGANNAAPENTLPAFEKAIALGCDGVELDLHLTSDGELAVIHDDTLNRTTNGSGKISEYTMMELKELDAGSYFSTDFKNTRIPTLDQALYLISKANLYVEIELKGKYKGIEEKVINIIHKYHYEKNCTVTSFNRNYLKNIKSLDSHINTGICFSWTFNSPHKIVEDLNLNVLSIDYRYIEFMSQNDIKNLKANKVGIYGYTVNSKAVMIQMLQKNITGILTDSPDILLSIKKMYKKYLLNCTLLAKIYNNISSIYYHLLNIIKRP